MREEVRRALQIDDSAGMAERTIDITTTGRRSGEQRRILTPIVANIDRQRDPDSPLPSRTLDEWVADAPLVKVAFDDI